MEAAAVLDVYSIADADIVDITAYDCIEPYGTLVAHDDIAYDGGIFGEITVCSPCWGFAADGFDKGHMLLFFYVISLL